jgi:acyl carrier protein|tara:strand:+ start:657 stop:899 length:243 start_codon:yes stop_codon:yes gene_type:complete
MSTNIEKYNQVFIESFSIGESDLNDELIYESIPEWDSVGHMGMIAGLEDAFEITMEMDDIIDFESYNKGKELLSKYNISF